MIKYLLEQSGFLIYLFEFVAALVGTIWTVKKRNPLFKSFTFFLWFTFLVEVIGRYTSFIGDFEFLNSLKDTVFVRNYWLYNFYGIFQIFFFILFYQKIMENETSKKILKWLLVSYFLATAIILILNYEDYFFRYINENFYVGTTCVLICVFLYFYEVLQSDKILVFYKSFGFYVSVGLLIWWLVFPPLIVYYSYYNPHYPEFIDIRNLILLLVNVFMYTCFIFGFICSKHK